MNNSNQASKTSIKFHLIIELFLCVVIVFLLVKCTSEIKVDSRGFVKDAVLNYSILQNGTIVVANSSGEVISSTDPKENSINQISLKELHSLALAVTQDDGVEYTANIKVGLIDRIISPAMATEHNKKGHVYRQYNQFLDGKYNCFRFDVTEHWKPVHPCI